MDAFVHASGDGFGNTAPLRSDTGAIDMDAISQVAHVTQGAGKLTRKEKKHAKREMKRRKKEAKKAEKEAKKTYSSIKSQLKDRDKELSDKMADARKKRDSAKDVVNYIGYNKMYQDGIKQVVNLMESSFEKRSGNLERILAPDLLILEDLGAQRSTEYVMEHVYDVIDGRYKAGKPMVITTNFDFRERILNATADDPWGRVFDRIVEVGFPVKYDGNSRRREIGMKNRKDFKRKLGIERIES